jgi:hypothetical protein
MLSAVITSERSQPAVLLAEQLAHQRFVRPGPLVLRTALLKTPTRAADRDRTVSRRYPRGTFYPLSDGASTCHRQITSPDFRPCLRCLSHSQAPLCTYTRNLIANQAEGTFGRLRYLLGGDRPSQTTHQALSLIQIMDLG